MPLIISIMTMVFQSYLIYVNKHFLTIGNVCFPYSDMAFVLVSKLATRPGFARVQY